MMPRLARLAARLLPAGFRERYGDELLELLDGSPRPLADIFDVLILAAREHLEVLMRRPLYTLSITALGVSLVVFGYALNDLGAGPGELLQHWWSGAAVAAVITSGAAALVTRRRLAGDPGSRPLTTTPP